MLQLSCGFVGQGQLGMTAVVAVPDQQPVVMAQSGDEHPAASAHDEALRLLVQRHFAAGWNGRAIG